MITIHYLFFLSKTKITSPPFYDNLAEAVEFCHIRKLFNQSIRLSCQDHQYAMMPYVLYIDAKTFYRPVVQTSH